MMVKYLFLTIFVTFCVIVHHVSGQAIDPDDEAFLEELEKSAFLFFWEQADQVTGQVKDRSHADNDPNFPFTISSIAATGYGLTALGIGHWRNYSDRALIEERVETTIKFIYDGHVDGHRGFYYHFVHMNNGSRAWNSELSSIDTALLINGILFARQYFHENPRIVQMANEIYDRVDYAWMLDGDTVLSMGWHPENDGEFISDKWDRYCELLMLVLQAIGSKTHPVPLTAWTSFRREKLTYDGQTYITTVNPSAPIFIHQFSHAWYDFFNKTDAFTDYYENTKIATIVHKKFCLELAKEEPLYPYSDNYWGLTASDTPYGYTAWGGPPAQGPIDGSVVPCAAAGSIPFLPEETISMLRSLNATYDGIWKRYGFIDAFNPRTDGKVIWVGIWDNFEKIDKKKFEIICFSPRFRHITGLNPLLPWYNPDVIGIDVGVTMLMAENYRSKFVWEWFMKDVDVLRSMKMVGFTNIDYELEDPTTTTDPIIPTTTTITEASGPTTEPTLPTGTPDIQTTEASDSTTTEASGSKVDIFVFHIILIMCLSKLLL